MATRRGWLTGDNPQASADGNRGWVVHSPLRLRPGSDPAPAQLTRWLNLLPAVTVAATERLLFAIVGLDNHQILAHVDAASRSCMLVDPRG